MQAQALEHATLHEHRIDAQALPVFRMLATPLEDIVHRVRHRVRRAVRSRLQVERDLAAQQVRRQLQAILVLQQHGEYVARQCRLLDLPLCEAGEQRLPALDRGREETMGELRERRTNFRAQFFLVAARVNHGRAFAERPDQPQQCLGFLRRALGPIDAGEVRGQVHGDAEAEIDQVAASARHRRTQQLRQRTREDFRLVVAKEAALEHAELEHATRAVLLAMQRQQRAVHDHLAFVVQRLREVGVAQGRECIGDRVQADRGHRCLP